MTVKKTVYFSLLMVSTLLIPGQVRARLSDPYTDIPDIGKAPERRVKDPDYSLMKVNLGGEIGGYYDSNIFRASNNEEGDFITILNPSIDLETDFEDHGLDAYAEIESRIYTSNSDSNYTNLEFGFDGYYTLSHIHQLFGDFAIGQHHTPMGSFVDDPNDQLAEPVSYTALSSDVGLNTTFENWMYSVSGQWDSFDYDNTQRLNGTTSIQDDRDRDDFGLRLKGGYHVSPQMTIYGGVSVNKRDYDNRTDSSAAFTRDSDGFDVMSGIIFEGVRFEGDFAMGYMQQNYDAVELPSVSGLAFLWDGMWMIDKQNEIRIQADSTIKDTTNMGVSGYIQNRFRMNYGHDFDQKNKFGINLQYIHNDFETNFFLNSTDREDDVYDSEVYVEREIYDNINLSMSYRFRQRESNVATAEYGSHIISARLIFDY